MSSNGRIRVHAVIDSLGLGGAEMLLAEFAGPAQAQGIDLSVGYLKDSLGDQALRRLRQVGIEPEFVPVSSMVSPQDLNRLRRHLARVRPDVVHTHLGTSDCLGVVASRLMRLPAVGAQHQAE